MLLIVCQFQKIAYFCIRLNAQMAELVDALVSNTSGFTSMPVRSRLWVLLKAQSVDSQRLSFFYFLHLHNICTTL